MGSLKGAGGMRADFGFSISAMHSVAQTEVGTPNYCAPEVLMRATMDACYDGKKADGARWHQRADASACARNSLLADPCMRCVDICLESGGAHALRLPLLRLRLRSLESFAASMPLCYDPTLRVCVLVPCSVEQRRHAVRHAGLPIPGALAGHHVLWSILCEY